MRISFAPKAINDLGWFEAYYRDVFPEGGQNADLHFLRTVSLLKSHPQSGHVSDETGRREITIPKTPFSIIYRIKTDHLRILRIWDGRQNPFRK
jgi:toxin ParE1/3/4